MKTSVEHRWTFLAAGGSSTLNLPALKKIGENAKLTQPQKDLVASLTKNLAPGLKGLPGLK